MFVLYCRDNENVQAIRERNYPAHKAFLAEAEKMNVTIILSGPLVSDDNVTPIGSLFVIEVPDRATAEAFNRADPFYTANVWREVTITPFLRRR